MSDEIRARWAKFCEDRGGFATSYDPTPLAQHAHLDAHGLGATFDAATGEFTGSFSYVIPDDWTPVSPAPPCPICRDFPTEWHA